MSPVTSNGHRVILRTELSSRSQRRDAVAAPLSVHPSGLPAYPDHPAALARLQGFRAGLYACLTRRADALSTWPMRC